MHGYHATSQAHTHLIARRYVQICRMRALESADNEPTVILVVVVVVAVAVAVADGGNHAMHDVMAVRWPR